MLTSPALFLERFWAKIEQRAEDECWPWIGSVTQGGYGQIGIRGRPERAHRIMAALFGKSFASEQHVHHLCGNTNCVNPDHLEVMDASQHLSLHNQMFTDEFCPQGHPGPFTRDPRGRRYCTICHSLRRRRCAEKKLTADRSM